MCNIKKSDIYLTKVYINDFSSDEFDTYIYDSDNDILETLEDLEYNKILTSVNKKKPKTYKKTEKKTEKKKIK